MQNVLVINTYGGSLLLGAKAVKANVVATMEDTGYGSDLQAMNFPKIPRYEKTADWPEKFLVPWSKIDVISHPPCKSFSTMAARYNSHRGTADGGGFDCHRGVMSYALGHGCRSLAIESVMGAYAGGREEYETAATKYGYHVVYVFLNAVAFGIPQYRPRVWMIFTKRRKFFVNFKPKYVPLQAVLDPGPTTVPVFSDTKLLWEKTRPLLKGKNPIGHIFAVLQKKFKIDYAGLRAKYPMMTRGYLSGYVRFLDPTGFATTLLGDTTWAVGDRLLTIEEYCAIMGFPRNYKFNVARHPNNYGDARSYLSRGVCPPIAAWILKAMDLNASGWKGEFTHQSNDEGIIDLRVRKIDALAETRRACR
jgi:site-specific DNA-cytosine methylase